MSNAPKGVRGPRGWKPGSVETRFADAKPDSYDVKQRTVDAVLSVGTGVQRFYGTEVLKISPEAVTLDRVAAGAVPLLDTHNQSGIDAALGRLEKVWFDRGSLMGRIRFNDTEQGRKAEGMVARGELSAISIGYRVNEWEVTDGEGNVLDPERDRIHYDDDLTFTAVKWELYEASLVTVPADPGAAVRALGGNEDLFTGAVEVVVRAGDKSMTYRYREPLSGRPHPPEQRSSVSSLVPAALARMRLDEAMRERDF